MSNDELRDRVRERYATVARSVREGGGSCCGYSEVEPGLGESLVRGDCSDVEKRELPQAAAEASLGCGNPVALATLSLGEVVLDLGSGGGIDVLLSARRVGPEGKAYGLDMTDEMLELARKNQVEARVENVEFLKGEIEAVPLPDSHVDVVISNCFINLSTEKEKVLAEAFRVLRPGGRFAVSDVVFLGRKRDLPAEMIRSVELWAGCVSGALEKDEYEALLVRAGFEEVGVEVTHSYEPEIAVGVDAEALRRVPIASAFVRGRKPEGS